MVDYVLDAAAGAKLLTDVAVTSDSEEVLARARLHPPFHCIPRPAALSTVLAPSIDYVRHALDYLGAQGRAGYHAIVIIQPTSPFTLAEDIDATVTLLADPAVDSAVSIMEIPHDLNPLKFKTLGTGDRLHPYLEDEAGRMAAHEMPKVYVRNGSVYATKVRAIDEGKVIGDHCVGYLMPRLRSHDLNDEFDWLVAEVLLKKQTHL